MRRLLLLLAASAIVLAACGEGESIVEPGPGDPEETTTTTTADDDTDGESDDVVTDDEVAEQSTTTTTVANDGGGGEENVSTTTVLIDENSENAAAYVELAASGLVLTLEEQACADETAAAGIAAEGDPVDSVIEAVQVCASPKALDDFASRLITAGGLPLPPTEAACVASRLGSTDDYRPFWVALLDEEPFDFLLADLEVQNRYLDLYAECVSVGRAVGAQANIELSPPTMGCVDDLYRDREFVRITIEADLSGDEDERARIDRQIASCLTSDERAALDEA